VDCDLPVDFDLSLFEKICAFVPGKSLYDAAQFAHAVNNARQARRC
jgi:hypothetical protein